MQAVVFPTTYTMDQQVAVGCRWSIIVIRMGMASHQADASGPVVLRELGIQLRHFSTDEAAVVQPVGHGFRGTSDDVQHAGFTQRHATKET